MVFFSFKNYYSLNDNNHFRTLIGDPRRPYPTDMDMRQGHLGRLNDLTIPEPSPVASLVPAPSLSHPAPLSIG